jgi:hypothetical protein
MTDEQEYRYELRNFLDSQGRLKSYPAKRKLQIVALFYLATKFKLGKQYSEKEVNQLLDNWHSFEDSALLRRGLHDLRLLDRENDGSKYWLIAQADK